MATIVIMPGGFHPFHAGHYALYRSAVEAFPDADVYVAATNDTSARPFPFPVKEKLAQLAGVAPNRFVQVKSPFKAEEITTRYNPLKDTLIFVRSDKDTGSPPQPGGTKRDGSPSYLQPLAGQKELEPFAKHAYMAYLPTVEFGPGMTSATEIRTAWPRLNDKRKTALVMSLYPRTQGNAKLAATVVGLLDTALNVVDESALGNLPRPNKRNQFKSLRKQRKERGLDEQGVAEAAKKCPPATQDITLNLKNRQKAIDEYGYGPLNPDMPNTKFWMKKVDEWNLDSVEEAQQSLCGNCAAFDIRQETLDCIAQGIDSDAPEDAEGVIDAGDLGYCKFLKFKCASRRTCDAWVTGGPLQDKPIDENQGWAATYEEVRAAPSGAGAGMTAGYQRRENQPIAEKKSKPKDPELIRAMQYIKQHYPTYADDADLGMAKWIQRSLKHSEENDQQQNVAISRINNKVEKLAALLQRQRSVQEQRDYIDEKWSEKYKSSINCANPRGFSQRAHCAGRKK